MSMRSAFVLVLVLLASGCASNAPGGSEGDAAVPAPHDLAATAEAGALAGDQTPLEVRFLGVGGFLLRRGHDAVITAPLYTNPTVLETSAIGNIASNPAQVAKFAAGQPFSDVRAVLVGHAHYDHLMDVPTALPLFSPDAIVYGNQSMAHILAAFAPDRASRCSTPAPAYFIPRDRVVALDAPGADKVERRVCAGGSSTPGAWVAVPGGKIRVLALCSEHPAQLVGYHFGAGSVDADLCDPPTKGEGWREGLTLAYLIDFLDDAGQPAYRVYYQDAPTHAPIGHVPADILAGKRVDAALLCVGNYDQVPDQPGAILHTLKPRYAIGGHWENFFQPQDQPLQAIPLLDVEAYRLRGDTIMGASGEAPIIVDGVPTAKRHFVPNPGTTFTLSRAQP